MGWFTSTSTDASNREDRQPSSKQSEPMSSDASTRQNVTDQNLESFLQDLERPQSHKTSRASQDPSHGTSSASSETSQTTHADSSATKLDISPAALYPRTMSCRAAFDQAFYCQSLGGKFNDIYRYGSLQSCSENWNQFWFCMRNRTLGGGNDEAGESGRRTAEYFAQWEQRKKEAYGSSEEVWKLRTVPVDKAFWRTPDGL